MDHDTPIIVGLPTNDTSDPLRITVPQVTERDVQRYLQRNGASGTFKSADGKIITVENGLVTDIDTLEE